jgi:hypothetical protein
MKTTKKILLSIYAIVALSSTSPGAFMLYTDTNSFFAAISLYNPGKISFSNIPTGTAFPNASFSTNGYTLNASSAGGLYGETYSADPTIRLLSVGGAAADDLVFTFSTNVYAIGGWFLSAESNIKPGSFTATIVDAVGNTNIFTNNTTTDYNNAFLGWVYDTNIASLTLSTDPENQGFPTAADSITLAVPEPSTYALLGLAAAGLAGYVIRRRRA